MAKNPDKRENSQTKKNSATHTAILFLVAGFLAEAYLLLLRRFYINGTLEQVVAWDGYLQTILYVGLGVTAVGAVAAAALWKKPGWPRTAGLLAFGAGAFLAVSTWLVRTYVYTALTPLCVIVPVVMVLGLLWNLYDRECGYSLTILGVTVLVLWICRRGRGGAYNTVTLVIAVLYLAAMAALGWIFYQAAQKHNTFGKVSLLPPNADALPVYGACGLSLAAVIVGLISASLAYYAMWAVCLVIFALAVYYTVKQL